MAKLCRNVFALTRLLIPALRTALEMALLMGLGSRRRRRAWPDRGSMHRCPAGNACALCVDRAAQRLLEHVLVAENKGIQGLVPGRSSHLAISGQVGEECFDFLFPASQVDSGLHFMKSDMAFNPIAVGAFGMDGIMTSSHEVTHFVKYFGRQADLPSGLCYLRNLVSRNFGRLWTMIRHMADLLETGPDMVLSCKSAC